MVSVTTAASCHRKAPPPPAGATSTWDDPVHLGELWAIQAGNELAGTWSPTGTASGAGSTFSLPPMSLWAEIGSWAWGDRVRSGKGADGAAGRKELKAEPFPRAFLGSTGISTPDLTY